MKERFIRQLGPEVRQVLTIAKSLTGKEPVLKRVQNLPDDVHAMLRWPETPSRPYEIHYVKGRERFLPHLIAHEVGHLVRLFKVPEDERLMPVITLECRRRAAEQLIPEFAQMVRRGLPDTESVLDIFDTWQRAVISQLTNFPADFRIENWIFTTFPGLHRIQQRSLIEEVQRGFPFFQPEVRRYTPATVYRATMAMNAAQAYHVTDLYAMPELMQPFDKHGFGEIGRQLARMILETDGDSVDEGHRSDMAVTNAWAQELGLREWFQWPGRGMPYHILLIAP